MCFDRSLSVSFSLAVGLLSLFSVTSVFAQSGSTGGEWRYYAGDIGATKYSPLDQISRDNVGDLRIAWERAAVDQSILDAAPDVSYGNNFIDGNDGGTVVNGIQLGTNVCDGDTTCP